jgi:hypothetical protein
MDLRKIAADLAHRTDNPQMVLRELNAAARTTPFTRDIQHRTRPMASRGHLLTSATRRAGYAFGFGGCGSRGTLSWLFENVKVARREENGIPERFYAKDLYYFCESAAASFVPAIGSSSLFNRAVRFW